MAAAVHKVALALHLSKRLQEPAGNELPMREGKQALVSGDTDPVPCLHTLAPLGIVKSPADLLTHWSFILAIAGLDARATTSKDALDVGRELVSKVTRLEACEEQTFLLVCQLVLQ